MHPRSFLLRASISLLPTVLALTPAAVHAGVTPNLTVGYMWNGTVVTQDGIFDFPLNEAHASQYTWPGGNAYGDVYKGSVGQAVLVDGHFLSNTGTKIESSDRFATEGEYFVVIYSVPPSIPDVRAWFINGTSTNPSAVPPANWGIVRFKVGKPEVELYTQVISLYPSTDLTQDWANLPYADGAGVGSCGTSIGSCGCALTSAVMIARFYDITTTLGDDVNPRTLNAWLQDNSGYIPGGGVNWNKIAEYTDYRMKFTTRDETTNNFPLLDSFLSDEHPMIARADPGRGHTSQHFFVIDKKLTSTYRVKDPRWYNTQTLDEPVTDTPNNVRTYLGGFDALRGFIPHDGSPYAAMTIALGSPAELLITDSLGRRLGKDPSSGIVYNDIPGGSYGSDDIGDPDSVVPPPTHSGKVAYLPELPVGNYTIEVIGTGEGPYTLQTTFADTTGASRTEIDAGTINENQTVQYEVAFNPNNTASSNITEVPSDTTPPELALLLDPITRTLTALAFDAVDENPTVVQSTNQVTATDAAGNTTIVKTKAVSRVGYLTGATIVSIQYNDDAPITPPDNAVAYGWKLKSGQINTLIEGVWVRKALLSAGLYTKAKNQTVLTTYDPATKKTNISNKPGLVIVGLQTMNGTLSTYTK